MHNIFGRRLWLGLAVFAYSVAAPAQNASTTTLAATPATITPGQTVTLSATVQAPVGDPAPTGSVQFTLNGEEFASAPLSGGAASYKASSAGIAPGTYPVVAKYGGDANTAASQSAPFSVTISDYTSATALVLNHGTVTRGDNATATATVTSSSGKPPAGTVTFYLDNAALTTVPLSNGSASVTGSTSALVGGAYQVKAMYNGNAQTAKSTSAVQPFSVKGTTMTAFAIAPAVVTPGGKVTLSVAVTGDSGKAASGTVSFFAGSTYLFQATVSGGAAAATVPTTGYPAGLYTITANYSGDGANLSSSGTTTVSLEQTTGAFAIAQAGAALATGGATQFSITPSPGSSVQWYVNGVAGGSAATGTINSSGNYTAPSAAAPVSVLVSATEAANPNLYSAPVPVYVVVPGSVGASNNTQVAAYTLNAPAGGEMSVAFGPTTAYIRNTWQQPTGGGATRMLVAGMTAPATWHMSATVDFGNGIVYQDPDQTFATTLTFNPSSTPTATLGAGMTPQPGFEMVDPSDEYTEAYDLQGNFIWGLGPPPGAGTVGWWQPVKLLPNGHLLTQFAPESAFPVDGTVIPAGTPIAAYEMELDGTVVRELTLAQLNANLKAQGYRDGLGNQITLLDMHHDLTLNTNTGHWLIMSNTTRVISNDPGTSGPTTVLGDVVVDVDPAHNFKVDWVWNSFDHLDVTRHPEDITDWTHSNAIVYSPTDHNILVSMRWQNWILKLDYNDAAGAGDILYHFGYQGELALLNSDGTPDTNIQDWNWAQHSPAFTTANTAGTFGLTFMDNGDDRQYSAGAICPVALTNGSCLYSRAPQFTVDEAAMTATLGTVMPFEGFSDFGGNAEILANGDAHADFCQVLDPAGTGKLLGYMAEYTGGDNPQFVWSLDMGRSLNAYRGQRWGSFYPGVTWTQ